MTNKNKIFNTLLVVIAVILLNMASLYVFTRFDFTEDQVFSISDASKDVLAQLDDRIIVKAYFSKELPAPFSSVSRYVRDILEEYKAYSKGNFYFEFISPGDDKSLEEEAMNFRVPPQQVQVLENDKFEIKKVFMGLVFLYQDKKEVMPLIRKTDGLEYDITSAIKKLTEMDRKTVGIVQGHGEPSLLEELKNLKAILEKQYNVIPVQLSAEPAVSADVDALLLISPQDSLSGEDLFKLDQFIMRGGKAAFLLNEHTVNIETAMATPLNLGLSPFLENYGIKINNDIVMDAQCSAISVGQQQGYFQIVNQVNYPFFPIVNQFNENLILVKDLEQVYHFFASSIDTSFAGKAGVKVEFLAKSSDKSGKQVGRFMVNPMQKYNAESFNESGLILSAAYFGNFKSYFSADDIPEGFDKNLYLSQADSNRILVVGEGNFVKDDYLSSAPDNVILISNMVDYLVQDEALISIRSRGVTSRPLKQIESQSAKAVIKWVNILVPPLLIVIVGLGLFYYRKNKRQKLIIEILNSN